MAEGKEFEPEVRFLILPAFSTRLGAQRKHLWGQDAWPVGWRRRQPALSGLAVVGSQLGLPGQKTTVTTKKLTSTSQQAKGAAPNSRSKQASKKLPSVPLTKSETIQSLLARPQGATILELSEATSWQAHSVRGYLSGTVKKKLGLTLASSKSEGTRRYHLTKPAHP